VDFLRIGYAEMLVRNYVYTLHNSPEECRFHLLRGGRLKSRKVDGIAELNGVSELPETVPSISVCQAHSRLASPNLYQEQQ
jgi:hypothetical protein